MSTFGAVFDLADLDGTNGFKVTASGGHAVASGDLNGDGFSDILIGNPLGGEGRYGGGGAVSVVFGKSGRFPETVPVEDLDGSNGFHIFRASGEDSVGRFGQAVSAGDINGDGFDDLIIGAVHSYQGFAYGGDCFVVFGHSGDFDEPELDQIALDSPGVVNTSVASGGDINGDGFDDVVIGRSSASPLAEPDVTLLFGASDPDDIGIAEFNIEGETEFDNFGTSVAFAGDVNGDGFDDLIVGASGAAPDGQSTGASYVVFGHAGGFPANLDISALDGENGFRIDGAANLDLSGSSVASAGDVNGDGFDDLIIGAPGADPNGAASGASYVVFGQADEFGEEVDLSTLDGENGFQISGETAFGYSGTAVASAGDVNGDGFDDLIIGAPGTDASYVVFGHAGDFDAELDLAELDGANGFQIVGTFLGYAGRSVSSAGDVNGDGFDDLIVGEPGADASYVIFGQATGPIDRVGTESADRLFGGDFKDSLEGLGGDDLLDGRGGADTMLGGAGNDTYVVDNAGDVVRENGGEGADTVHASISYGLGASVNNLTLTGNANINGTGTGSANTLIGNSGRNTLDARGGDDRIDGGAGADTMLGGEGDDTYVVDNSSDLVTENGGEGADTVLASVTYKLGASVNNLTLTGSANINGTGTGSSNVLKGNDGRNALNGGDGDDTVNGGDNNDTLTGGAGADLFVFGDRDGNDLITDFENGTDTIDLSALDDVNRFRDLDITDTGGGVLIDYGNGTIQLDNVASATSITADDFIFA